MGGDDDSDSSTTTNTSDGASSSFSSSSSSSSSSSPRPPCLSLLLANSFVMGTLVALVECYLFLFISSSFPSSSNGFLGLCTLVMTLSEVPVFLKEDFLVRRVGTTNLQTLAHIMYVGRVLSYSYIPESKLYIFLLLEPSHGR